MRKLLSLLIFLVIFAQEIRFQEVARELGINVPGGLGACCAFFDYNNDDYLDIIFNAGNRVYLFRNNLGLNFVDVTDSAGLSNYEFRNLVIGDYNNDGYLDILANSHGSDCYLFRNNGNGTFTEVASLVGLTSGGYRSLFLDYNRDGLLDVLIIGSQASYLYRQDNSNSFQLVHTFVNGNTGVAFDYNNDLYPDIYIGRNGENKLYKNINGDTFIDLTSIAGVGNTGYTQGVVSGDFDNDGDLDLYLTNIGDALNALYVNQGNGTFINRTSFYGVGDVGDGRTCDIIDFNNDRLFDIFSTNHVYPNRLFRNMGYNVPFYNVAGLVNIAQPQDVFAASWGDFDNDGDLDVFLTGHFGSGYALMKNNGGNYFHYLKVKLVGTQSNRAGIGSKIYLFKNDTCQMIEISGGSGQDGHNSLIAHFGLGNNNSFDSLIVLWPSGERSRILFLPVDTLLTILEPLTEIKEETKLKKKNKNFGIYDVIGKKTNNLDKKGIYFILKEKFIEKLIRR